MGRAEKAPKCTVKGCKKDCFIINKAGRSRSNGYIYKKNYYLKFCSAHQHNATIDNFLGKVYQAMGARVRGIKGSRCNKYYVGKTIAPRDVFMDWAKKHPDFLKLYKQYYMSNFERRLAPSPNRIDSKRGYEIYNIEWVTFSQNAMMASAVRKMNNRNRKAVYKILGVNNG